jgi:serine/threonine-protein kinase
VSSTTLRAGHPEGLDGRYLLIDCIGQGGSATVWRARDSRLDRPVAVKIVTSATNERARVVAEAKALAQLCHPHIANVFDVGETPALAYLVMEFARGRSLASVLAARELPREAGIACVAQIAAAVAAAHARGIVHRDVTPANVMVTRSGAKLIDFGLSALRGSPEVDPDGSLRGTPAYVAPERLDGQAVGPAADVYSLGVVLAQCLTGRLWGAPESGEPDALDALPDDTPPDVVDACRRCLAREPADRPDAAGLAAILHAAVPARAHTDLAQVAAEPGQPPRSVQPSRVGRGGPRLPRHRRVGLAVAAMVLAAATLVWPATTWSPSDNRALPQAVLAPDPVTDHSAMEQPAIGQPEIGEPAAEPPTAGQPLPPESAEPVQVEAATLTMSVEAATPRQPRERTPPGRAKNPPTTPPGHGSRAESRAHPEAGRP